MQDHGTSEGGGCVGGGEEWWFRGVAWRCVGGKRLKVVGKCLHDLWEQDTCSLAIVNCLVLKYIDLMEPWHHNTGGGGGGGGGGGAACLFCLLTAKGRHAKP